MNKEALLARKEEREAELRRVNYILWDFKEKLNKIRRFKGHSSSYKLLEIALNHFEDDMKLNNRRYDNRVAVFEAKDDIKQLQQSLNRERKLREQLETKVKEASESSGLFISYVREKLGI